MFVLMKNLRFLSAILVLMSLGAYLYACGNNDPRFIDVTPANPIVSVQGTQQFTATGTFSDGSTQDMTSRVTWNSSNTVMATINTAGLATGIAPGTVTIAATFGNTTGSAYLAVTSATLTSISITPADASIPPQTNQQFAATGTFSDGTTYDLTSQAAWSSSNPSVAIINSSGIGTAIAAGTTTISATSASISGSTVLTVQ